MAQTYPFLEDEQLRLRAPEPEDLEVMYRIENNPSLWMMGSTTVPYSRYVLRKYIETAAHDIYQDRQLRLMVERKTDGKVLGCADLTDFDPRHDRAEVGMVILHDEQGKGMGSRALTLLCHYAFGFLHLHQLYAYVAAGNERSLSLFAKCGFVRRTLLEDWLRMGNESGGRYEDAVMMQRVNG